MDNALFTTTLNVISTFLAVTGVVFFLAGTVGLLRLPDLFSRLHALTKADNLGLGLVVLAILPQAPDPLYALKLVLLWILVLFASATGAHLIAKRAVRGDGEDIA